MGYTRPVVLSKRLQNKQISSGMATFIVLNKEGWALTAAHVVQDVAVAAQHTKESEEYNKQVALINSDESTSKGKKKFLINQLKYSSEWITNNSVWWSGDGVGFDIIHFDSAADLAVAKLNGPVEKLNVTNYPVFANIAPELTQGTSLCRLGFPFHELKVSFDETTAGFRIDNMPPSLATFPNDGICTRHVMCEDPSKRQIHFVETSSAGLRGQSGGPIFDVKGNVWALQSRTSSLSLGFAPKVKQNGREITEHQFMHVGWGIHVSHIRELLEKLKVPFQSA